MALCRQNVSVARPNRGTDVFGLAGLLRDDDLVSHLGLVLKIEFYKATIRTYSERKGQ